MRRRAASGAAALCALVASVGAAHGAETRWARLPDLLRQGRLVVTGTVTRTAAFDDGRVVVAYLRPDGVLKGDRPPGEAAVVEEHDLPSSPTLLPSGRSVVVFLVQAPRTSSLARALPPGTTYWVPVQGRMGVLASESPESIREAAAIVARWAAIATDSTADASARTAAQRALAFDEIAAAHPVVVEDGVTMLRSLTGLTGSLDEAERRRIAQALGRRDLPSRVTVALVQAIATQRLAELLPALRDLKDPPADVLAASWEARRQLGSPPSAASLVPFLAARDPTIRAVAAPALLATGDREAAPRIERLTREDTDPSVRKAATQALGSVKALGGLAALERIYASSPELRTDAGNAILAWGGDEAADALARLAFEAPPDAQQWAVTLLFALGRKQDDPRLARVRTTHPDPAVRDLVERGFDLGTHHH